MPQENKVSFNSDQENSKFSKGNEILSDTFNLETKIIPELNFDIIYNNYNPLLKSQIKTSK